MFDTQGLLKTGIVMGAARVKRGGRKVGLANGSEGSGYEGISRLFHTQSIPLDPRTHAVARGRLVAGAALGYAVDTPPDFGLPRARVLAAPRLAAARAVCRLLPRHRARRQEVGERQLDRHRPCAGADAGAAALGFRRREARSRGLAAQLPNARVLPKLSMMDAVTLAQQAALAIGVDTGLTHIAAAFYTPTVEIYADSPKWKTEGNWSPRIVNLGDKGAPPGADEVIASARRLLDSLDSR